MRKIEVEKVKEKIIKLFQYTDDYGFGLEDWELESSIGNILGIPADRICGAGMYEFHGIPVVDIDYWSEKGELRNILIY